MVLDPERADFTPLGSARPEAPAAPAPGPAVVAIPFLSFGAGLKLERRAAPADRLCPHVQEFAPRVLPPGGAHGAASGGRAGGGPYIRPCLLARLRHGRGRGRSRGPICTRRERQRR